MSGQTKNFGMTKEMNGQQNKIVILITYKVSTCQILCFVPLTLILVLLLPPPVYKNTSNKLPINFREGPKE